MPDTSLSEQIPESLDDFSPEWLTRALRADGSLQHARVVGVEPEILGQGEGFMGLIARLKLEFDEPEAGAPTTLIAKLPTPIAKNRVMGELLGAYEREVRFYDGFCDKIPLRAPHCYYGARDPNPAAEYVPRIISTMDRLPIWLIRLFMAFSMFITRFVKRRYALLLEDLAPARLGNQLNGCSVQECGWALRTIARMHASLWESPLLDEHFWLQRLDLNPRTLHSMYQQSRSTFRDRHRERDVPGLEKIMEWLDVNALRLFSELYRDSPHTMIHGDFRLDNMFFEEGRGEEGLRILDFQISGRAPGAYDVAYFIGGSLAPDTPHADEIELLRDYHATLSKHGVANYGFEQCLRDYRISLLMVLHRVAMTNAIDISDERGVALMNSWVDRLAGRIRHMDLDALLDAPALQR